jgi:Recombinase
MGFLSVRRSAPLDSRRAKPISVRRADGQSCGRRRCGDRRLRPPGWCVARHLLSDDWPVRVVTRRPDGSAARALAALGADVVRADMPAGAPPPPWAPRSAIKDGHLGGRPPYGYRLVDAGPHPNRDHARWGRRLHRLEPDPVTAPQVRWIFAQRLTGASTASIARALNDRGVPSPAAHDPRRNRHRLGPCWTRRTVAAILENPRYTGRQLWNRQRTDHREIVPGNKQTSLGPIRVWNRKADWIVSAHRAHPALINDADFLAAQTIRATGTPHDSDSRRYALTGLLICGPVGAGCTHTGSTADPATAAATDTPAPSQQETIGGSIGRNTGS